MKKYISAPVFFIGLFILSSCGVSNTYSYYDDCIYMRPDDSKEAYHEKLDVYNDLVVSTDNLYNNTQSTTGVLTKEQQIIFDRLSSDTTASQTNIYNIDIYAENDPYLGYSSMYYGPWQPWFYGWGSGYSYNWGYNDPWYWDPWYRYQMTGFSINWMFGMSFYPGSYAWAWYPWYYPAYYPFDPFFPYYGYYPYYPCYCYSDREVVYGRRTANNSGTHYGRRNSNDYAYGNNLVANSGNTLRKSTSRTTSIRNSGNTSSLKVTPVRGSVSKHAATVNGNMSTLKNNSYLSQMTNHYVSGGRTVSGKNSVYRAANTGKTLNNSYYLSGNRNNNYIRNNNTQIRSVNTRNNINSNFNTTNNTNKTYFNSNTSSIRNNSGTSGSGSASRTTFRTNRSRR